MADGEEISAREQCAFLAAVYESADIGICVTDEQRRFVLVNEAYCTTYGYDRGELIGQPFTKVLPEDLRDKAARLHDEFIAGGEESAGEWRVRRKDGSIRDVVVTAGRVVTTDGRRFKVTTVRDVTEFKRNQAHFQTLSDMVSQAQHGVLYTDPEGLVTWANDAQEHMTGFKLDAMRGHKPGDLFQGERTDPETVAFMRRRIAAGEGFQVDMINYTRSGSEYWVHIACSPVRDTQGRLEGFMALQTDITEQKRFQERIEHLSFRDALTGLPNRRMFEEDLKYRIECAREAGNYNVLLFIDLDDFKSVNNTLGPRSGDELLVRVARTLNDAVDNSEMVARVGADEFAVVLLDLGEDRMAAVEHVEAVANRIFEAVALQFGQSGLQHYITASIGAVLFDGDEPPVEQVIQQADVAVYQAKCAGRNSLAFFDPRVQNKLMQRHRLEQELREAIRGNQLVPYYQGQYDAGGKLVGVELLIRWQHPERGLLTPGDFIPVAEASGLIVELGERVVRLAVDQLVRWAAHEHTAELPVSVNISACHFEQPGFVERLATIVENRSLRPFALKLEITESVLAHDLAGVSQRIAALHDIGIGLSLDDFGTGYSSLAYLKRLPIHQVKIDQTFVRDLLVDDNDLGITETIITLADTLGMDVVAEGVEEEAQRDVLERLGCRVFQGFLFGRPAPIAQFESDHDLNPDTIDHWS